MDLERLLLAFRRALEVPEALRSWDPRTNACSGTWRGILCNQDRNSVTELYATNPSFGIPFSAISRPRYYEM